jgi:hypothetical protein
MAKVVVMKSHGEIKWRNYGGNNGAEIGALCNDKLSVENNANGHRQ